MFVNRLDINICQWINLYKLLSLVFFFCRCSSNEISSVSVKCSVGGIFAFRAQGSVSSKRWRTIWCPPSSRSGNPLWRKKEVKFLTISVWSRVCWRSQLSSLYIQWYLFILILWHSFFFFPTVASWIWRKFPDGVGLRNNLFFFFNWNGLWFS